MALTTVNPGLLDNQAQYTGFKNRIINGAMMIDQRNAGASINNPNGYTVDRFTVDKGGSYAPTACTVQQSSVAPGGLRNSLSFSITTGAGAPTAAQSYRLLQSIEGYNVADLMLGTANAQTFTLSFWVRSSVTGTYAVAVRNGVGDRSYVTSYTVNAASTWEHKTVTIPGCTDGTWNTTNSSGMDVIWDLGVGSNFQTTANAWANGNYFGLASSVKLSTQTGATFYITGVQLEKGSTATSFDYRPYGTELALCQRYGYPAQLPQNLNQTMSAVVYPTTTLLLVPQTIPPVMRVTPTATNTVNATSAVSFINYGGGGAVSLVPTATAVNVRTSSPLQLEWVLTAASSWGTANYVGSIGTAGSGTSSCFLSAEL